MDIESLDTFPEYALADLQTYVPLIGFVRVVKIKDAYHSLS